MNRSVDPKKVNAELFTLTYGALVVQLLSDLENTDDVNKHLDKMGYNIGVRLVEDFIARTGAEKCYDLRETADKIQAAFRLYLGVSPSVGGWSAAGDEFSLTLDTNPLSELVELPDSCAGMRYCGILPGVIRGACEMVHLEVSCWFSQDQLRGDPVTELRVKFIRRLEDAVPPGED